MKNVAYQLLSVILGVTALSACTVKFPNMSLGCGGGGSAAALVRSNNAASLKEVDDAKLCPEQPLCYYEVYSTEPMNLEPVLVHGISFQPQLYLMQQALPAGVSPGSITDEARCYDDQSKQWIIGEPEEVLKQIHCL